MMQKMQLNYIVPKNREEQAAKNAISNIDKRHTAVHLPEKTAGIFKRLSGN